MSLDNRNPYVFSSAGWRGGVDGVDEGGCDDAGASGDGEADEASEAGEPGEYMDEIGLTAGLRGGLGVCPGGLVR